MRVDDLAVIGLVTITATLFVHRRLIAQPWFLEFLAVLAPLHVAAVMMFPTLPLDPRQFSLLALSDVLAVIGLVSCADKLVSRRKRTEAIVFPSSENTSNLGLEHLVKSNSRNRNPVTRRAA